jgi:hypothetical protein
MPIIRPINGENIIEHRARRLKPNAVIQPVTRSFVIIPFKKIILHKILFTSSLSTVHRPVSFPGQERQGYHGAAYHRRSPRIVGSHHVYKMPWPGDPRINLQKDGSKAKRYQVVQMVEAIEKLKAIKAAQATEAAKPAATAKISGKKGR